MDQQEFKVEKKYAETYRKSSRQYYENNKDKILEKMRLKREEANRNKSPKKKITNHYREVYRVKKIEQQLGNIVKETGVDENIVKTILEKYSLRPMTYRTHDK